MRLLTIRPNRANITGNRAQSQKYITRWLAHRPSDIEMDEYRDAEDLDIIRDGSTKDTAL